VKMTLAGENDLDEIMDLIRNCIEDMRSQGIFQWDEKYPTREIFQHDIETGSLHAVKRDNEIVGIVSMTEEQPPEYSTVNWSAQGGRILVVHRLAVNPVWHRRGIAGKLLNHVEEYATKNKYTSIRLDAYSGNPRALGLYEKHRYKRVGQVHFPRRDLPFYCYEKVLRSIGGK
jgi:ribosomal protein S18 acetylase RimI-like enzyme